MTRIFLIRHAEAEGNLYRRIHGHYDSLITENGNRQIAALRGRFEREHIDAVFSSDLYRTRTTARSVCEPRGLEPVTRSALREIHLGDWEDRTWGEVARTDPKRMRLFNGTAPAFRAPDGESFSDVQGRVCREIRAIAADNPGRTVAVFSHGTAIRCALAAFKGLGPEAIRHEGHSDNTAVSLLEFEGGTVRIAYQNDNSHLPEEISTLARQSWWKRRDGFSMDANLWFRPLDMARESGLYFDARKDAWLDIHKSIDNFDGEAFLADARAHWKNDRRAVLCAMLGDEVAGVLQLDLRRDAERGVGYIPFVYLKEKYRMQGMGVQLIGQAVSTYRPLGRNCLRLRCAPDNMVAQRFYRRYGFRRVGEAEGTRVPLDILEKQIGY